MHIKYGAVRGDGIFVVKIATGFYENPSIGLPSSGGVVLVFSARDGQLLAILQDEGHLTDIRTAAAGAVAARWLMPSGLDCIGICGSGNQARLQARYLREVTSCRNMLIWARNSEAPPRYRLELPKRRNLSRETRRTGPGASYLPRSHLPTPKRKFGRNDPCSVRMRPRARPRGLQT